MQQNLSGLPKKEIIDLPSSYNNGINQNPNFPN
jgi:hypothetical protein